MSLHHRHFTTFGAAVVLACALSQSAFAGVADLRSPDTRDVASSAQPTATADLRSPDSRDQHRFVPAPVASVVVDRRSPDTADLASGRVVTREPVVSISSPQGGFDWGDAGIGAGGAIAIVLLGLGAALMVTHRRRGIKPPSTVVP
jgi:hypothetical protein